MSKAPELDPLEEAIRSEPPSTLAEAGEHANAYITELDEIAKAHANNLLKATEESLSLTMRLVASLSPAGSPGPARLFNPPLEVVLTLGIGASPDSTALFKSAPRRGKGRPPAPPALILGQGYAAAVLTMLKESGLPKKEAAQRVAGRLERAGVRFDRANANPVKTIEYWRTQAKRPGPLKMAYKDALRQLRSRITPENAASRQQVLLKVLNELVARRLFE